MADSSFDIVSKIDQMELDNAFNNATVRLQLGMTLRIPA